MARRSHGCLLFVYSCAMSSNGPMLALASAFTPSLSCHKQPHPLSIMPRSYFHPSSVPLCSMSKAVNERVPPPPPLPPQTTPSSLHPAQKFFSSPFRFFLFNVQSCKRESAPPPPPILRPPFQPFLFNAPREKEKRKGCGGGMEREKSGCHPTV